MLTYNIRLIKWLNYSYDNRSTSFTLLWALYPTVFLGLLCRIFFILLKAFARIIYKLLPFLKPFLSSIFFKTDLVEGSIENEVEPGLPRYTIGIKDVFQIPFLHILLYRKIVVASSVIRDVYTPLELLSVTEMQAQKLAFKKVSDPLVSIIIPVYNKIEYTFNCLRTLSERIGNTISYEVIVINDNSSDHSADILGAIEGLVLTHNERNLGFLLSSNKGADIAKGKFLCFLNNDTEIQNNWLESLVETFSRHPDAGVVGSMLIYPDNLLQEAGGVIWENADGMNYGHRQDYLDPQYSFVRPVDYCSGASIMIQKKDFVELGGFEKKFIPAYYEDTDLCFSVRNVLGKKVLYQPDSKLIHHEGITSGKSTNSGAKKYQDINKIKFKEKWQSVLHKHLSDHQRTEGALRLCGDKTILIVDSYVPAFDKESGSCRMFRLIKIFKSLGYHVIFVPENGFPEQPYTRELQQMGVEVLYQTQDFNVPLMTQIEQRLQYIDIAWICRPSIVESFAPVFRRKRSIKIIYDTIDLHYIRMKREAELFPDRNVNWMKMKTLEQKSGKDSDLTIAITEVDKETLVSLGIENVETIPNIHIPFSDSRKSFEDRSGILFIGGYNHTPNVDAVLWLCNEIMPIVWAKFPDLKVTLLGSNPPEKVKRLAGPNVLVPGFIQDVSPYFQNNRIFVAPLTYGAGMKGKIGQSLEFSLPVVSTSIGVEGMGLKHNYSCLLAEDTNRFAEEIIRLYFDKKLWEQLSSNSEEALYEYSPTCIGNKMSEMLNMLIER